MAAQPGQQLSLRPAISVVMPMRNAARWLPVLLAALVREWSTGFELIAIDDGSTDASAAVLKRLCAQWPSERWTLLNGGGEGVSAARNRGVRQSRAKVIAFIDADDRPMPGRLAGPLQMLQNNQQLSHVHGGWWRCDANGCLQHPVRPWQEGAGFTWSRFMEHKAVLPSAWTVRRDAFLAVGGFDASIRHSEDVDLLLRLAAAKHRGAWIEQELVRYRIHSSNASARLQPQLNGLLAVMEKHLKTLGTRHEAWVREQRYSTTTWAVWQAWQAGDVDFALKLLSQALQDCPYPLVRRPVHLIEVMARSSARIGELFDRSELLSSRFWQQAEPILLAR
ncbi:glycosyltransferase family 2 protein [Synechococcus sp. MIT S9507]|uniref:glycosyltransferase family 2 protein n=1 Tax=Synechococcus sp. MIT S9507 TaxID=3082544 RepID=UPI0039B547EB